MIGHGKDVPATKVIFWIINVFNSQGWHFTGRLFSASSYFNPGSLQKSSGDLREHFMNIWFQSGTYSLFISPNYVFSNSPKMASGIRGSYLWYYDSLLWSRFWPGSAVLPPLASHGFPRHWPLWCRLFPGSALASHGEKNVDPQQLSLKKGHGVFLCMSFTNCCFRIFL